MHKRTKALAIPKAVKDRVHERDGGHCIICGKAGLPEAHYISRAHGGLGIEQNIATLCRDCHRRYDQSTERSVLGATIADYLRSKYKDWTPTDLVYRKDDI